MEQTATTVNVLSVKYVVLIGNSNSTERSTIQGVIERVISKLDECKSKADLKLRAWLLPELYDTRSKEKLAISITNFKLLSIFGERLLRENVSSTFYCKF